MGKGLELAFLQRRHTNSQQVYKICSVSLEKYTSKAQLNITSHLSEWLLLKKKKSLEKMLKN